MKERPILFSAPMVRAILAGTKTQTRRVVKPRHQWFLDLSATEQVRNWHRRPFPYGQPGERLWVREAWRIGAWDEENQRIAVDYITGPDKRWRQTPLTPEGQELFDRLWAQSSDECRRKGIQPNADGNYRWKPGESPLRWRPSMFMPRWASRITLEVTGLRVQRLQDISEADAIAEGITGPHNVGYPAFRVPDDSKPRYSCASAAFEALWCQINGADSWDANPRVWVVEFRRVQPC